MVRFDSSSCRTMKLSDGMSVIRSLVSLLVVLKRWTFSPSSKLKWEWESHRSSRQIFTQLNESPSLMSFRNGENCYANGAKKIEQQGSSVPSSEPTPNRESSLTVTKPLALMTCVPYLFSNVPTEEFESARLVKLFVPSKVSSPNMLVSLKQHITFCLRMRVWVCWKTNSSHTPICVQPTRKFRPPLPPFSVCCWWASLECVHAHTGSYVEISKRTLINRRRRHCIKCWRKSHYYVWGSTVVSKHSSTDKVSCKILWEIFFFYLKKIKCLHIRTSNNAQATHTFAHTYQWNINMRALRCRMWP